MNGYLIALLISIVLLFFTNKSVLQKKNNQLVKVCSIAITLMIVWCTGMTFQILLSEKLNIPPVYFDYFTYIGICFLPLAVFYLGNVYENTRIRLSKFHIPLFIFPIVTLLIIWTNDFHHLFYEKYALDIQDTKVGPWFFVYTLYEYALLFVGLFKLLRFSIHNAGFFSKQSLLIVLGISIPLTASLLGTLKIIPMNIYVTPTCFAFSILFVVIAIFKFSFLDAAPIALKKVVDNISDSYLVLDEYNDIIDFNKTFVDNFKYNEKMLRGKKFDVFLLKNDKEIEIRKFERLLNESKKTLEQISLTEIFEEIDKIFEIIINPVVSNGKVLGVIVLFKDITEHTKNLKQLEENQYIMQRQAQFSILGEFAGGLAHDLNSPLSAVQLDIGTLQKYVRSDKIKADPEVRGIITEMLDNINSSLNKMTMIIAGVRNQIRATGNTEKELFNLREVVDGIEILFGSILRKNNCQIENEIDANITIYGEKNKLDRVIGNIIKNSIDAYVEKGLKGKVFVKAKLFEKSCTIAIEDEAGGIDSDIAKTMFKEMKTTKAETGTGFGLYYSNTIIESSFGGKMSFKTEKGVGTTFYINIPIVKEEV